MVPWSSSLADYQVRSLSRMGHSQLLAFDARLAEVPSALIAALWEAIDGLATGYASEPLGVGRIRALYLPMVIR